MLPGGISLGLSSQYVSFLTSYRFVFFFFNDTATTEIYTLSLHDALPICHRFAQSAVRPRGNGFVRHCLGSEEHTSELQSHSDLVCRLLLEKKKPKKKLAGSKACRTGVCGPDHDRRAHTGWSRYGGTCFFFF